MGVKAYYQSPESLVLAKLRMIKATLPKERSVKDREDIRHILANTEIKKRKLLRLAAEQGTATILAELLKRRNGKPSRISRNPVHLALSGKKFASVTPDLVEKISEEEQATHPKNSS